METRRTARTRDFAIAGAILGATGWGLTGCVIGGLLGALVGGTDG